MTHILFVNSENGSTANRTQEPRNSLHCMCTTDRAVRGSGCVCSVLECETMIRFDSHSLVSVRAALSCGTCGPPRTLLGSDNLLRCGNLQVPHHAARLQHPQHAVCHVGLVPAQPLPRAPPEHVVVVVPAVPAAEIRNQKSGSATQVSTGKVGDACTRP